MSVDINIIPYDHFRDEVLVELVKNGDEYSSEYLIHKYRSFVRAKASKYFLMGGDREDIFQEGMIGLYGAIRNFKFDKMTSFKAFAELCITRQIISAVKTSTRLKHIPLNSSVSLDKPLYEEDSQLTLLDLLSENHSMDPETLIINKELSEDMEQKIAKRLSELERNVLHLYMDGHSYVEISKELNTHVKSIDNALQRVKRKLERHFDMKEVI